MTLKDVTVESYFDRNTHLIPKYDIKDCEELDYYINTLKLPEFQNSELKIYLDRVKNMIASPVSSLFVFPKFEARDNSIFDKKLLEEIDKCVIGKDLPFKMPSENYSAAQGKFRNDDIATIRFYLTHVGRYRKNAYFTVGCNKYNKLIDCVNLYDEFIDELLKDAVNNSKNITPLIFYSDRDKKDEIVLDNRISIAFNLLRKDNFIFGDVSDLSKQVMFDKIMKGSNETTDEFVRLISDYSLLSELKNNPKNPQVIKRLTR